MNRLVPPSGADPPSSFELADGTMIDLGTIARLLTDQYYEVYPDDLERYGASGRAWCEHDTRYLLAWALEDARAGTVNCIEQVQWLGRVLASRSFPLERLARHAWLTAAVLRSPEFGETGARAAERMSDAASSLI